MANAQPSEKLGLIVLLFLPMVLKLQLSVCQSIFLEELARPIEVRPSLVLIAEKLTQLLALQSLFLPIHLLSMKFSKMMEFTTPTIQSDPRFCKLFEGSYLPASLISMSLDVVLFEV